MAQSKPIYRRLVITAVILLLLIGVLIVALDWSEVRNAITAAQLYLIIPALIFVSISYFCLSYNFVLLNKFFGVMLRRRDLFEIGFVTIVISHIMSFAGVPQYSLRLVFMKSRGVAVGQILAPSAFNSYLNNLAMLLLFPIGIITLLLNHILTGSEVIGFAITVSIILVVLVLVSLIFFSQAARGKVLNALVRLWHFISHRDIKKSVDIFNDTLTKGVTSLRHKPILLIFLIALVAFDWVSTIVALAFCFKSIGNPIGIGVLVTGFAVGVTAGVVSMVPGGLGVQEGSMAGIYSLLGVPFGKAILAAVLFRVIYYFIPFFLSLGFYKRLLSSNASNQ